MENQSVCPLRVLFLPLSPKTSSEAEGFAQLSQHFSIPSAVFTEERQSVAYGFRAAKASADDADIAWCYFMSAGESPVVVPRRNRNNYVGPGSGSTWIRSSFFLHVRSGPINSDQASRVTLLCFGTQDCLVERFSRLLSNRAWSDILLEPYLLFDIIYNELFVLEDDLAWTLAKRFRPLEHDTLGLARAQSEIEMNVDFHSLHDISRGCVFMLESLEGSMLTLETMADHLRSSRASSPRPLREAVIQALEHRRRTFHSTSMRLSSLDKRIQNIIGLSFNLVTQSDSRVMKADSRAMKVIAVLTLVFLPATAVASVFSMPFFNVDFDDGSSRDLQAAASFWIFWVVVLPLTALVVAGWFWWYRLANRQRRREMMAAREGKAR